MTRKLSEATPKRTGWAAASWKPEIGGPVRDAIVPAGNVGQAKAEQVSRLVELLSYRIGHGSIHINNTSGYITELEERRPFVEKAINQAIAGRKADVIHRR